jgi:hypothetical protein
VHGLLSTSSKYKGDDLIEHRHTLLLVLVWWVLSSLVLLYILHKNLQSLQMRGPPTYKRTQPRTFVLITSTTYIAITTTYYIGYIFTYI